MGTCLKFLSFFSEKYIKLISWLFINKTTYIPLIGYHGYWLPSLCSDIWVEVFKNGPSKNCARQPLKNLKGYDLLKQTITLQGSLPQILLGPFLKILCPIYTIYEFSLDTPNASTNFRIRRGCHYGKIFEDFRVFFGKTRTIFSQNSSYFLVHENKSVSLLFPASSFSVDSVSKNNGWELITLSCWWKLKSVSFSYRI